jgi:hypothetical protein
MTATPPLPFRYIDGHMVPRSRTMADRYFAEGETYALEEVHARSHATHAHYFAALHDTWMNLPEALSPQYPSSEHLRKRLLIQAGYCDEQQIVFATENDAVKAAGLVLARDDYCVADVQGRALTIWMAKSQSMRAMGKATFQESKTKVLELAASLIGTTPETLTAQSQQHAAE